MKKFATSYPVEGTSALQLEADDPFVRDAAIIEFPGSDRPARSGKVSADREPSGRVLRAAESPARRSDLVPTLRVGDAAGKPFGRMRPWQALSGGAALSAIAFAGLFLAL